MDHHLSKVVASKEAPASLYLACFRSCSSSNRLGGGGVRLKNGGRKCLVPWRLSQRI